MSQSQSKGVFYGVGVGPGDVELMTFKAARLIESCDLVCYISNVDNHSMARNIAAPVLADCDNEARQELAIVMPMCDDRSVANRVYDEAANTIRNHLDRGHDVVFLCEGDPFFFGSFAYLHDRLNAEYDVQVVPGITSINAAAAACGHALGLLAENVAIISGRRTDEDIQDTLLRFDNVVIMKPGRRRAKLIELITLADRTKHASYIEYVGHENQRIVNDINTLDDQPGPYFSLFLIRRDRPFLQGQSV